MNALLTLFSSQLPRPQHHGLMASLATPVARRAREFGVGYGSSSGYAAATRYVPVQATPRFRFN